MRFPALRAAGLAVAGLTAAGLFAAAMPAQAAGTGSAYGASITATVAATVTTVDTGQLAPTGTSNPDTNSILGGTSGIPSALSSILTISGVVESTSAIDASNNVTESGGVTNVSSQLLQLNAQVLTANCTANAAAEPGGLTGSSVITSLTIGGTKINPTGDVNQTQTIAGVGTIILNEQTTNLMDQSLTVNALHIKPDGLVATGNILLGSVTCGAYLAPPTAAPGGHRGTP
ncbi:choice-of-anchor P family protein [Amycolatopsis sp. SID8362]|uniref:choice-of-anchor P family protein n=1 Tax=Amycolatopsis sp. SID8362 TaxID=2690346 RepID=UPI001369D901|nr:choice-of-anchor P family protein [Amycolatopsis sp. SID8362]NBH10390.1 hypothetical protein [Amycolatopsis sp. SID8362]NED47085.1 hypothetical protein [Amycolatopsis sp. SID8362]